MQRYPSHNEANLIHRWRLPSRLAALILGMAFLIAMPADESAASCVGPQLRSPTSAGVLRPGVVVTVRGRYFQNGCDDNRSGDAFGCSTQRETITPMQDVPLVIRQHGKSWTLGTASARGESGNQLGKMRWRVRLPADLERGSAVFEAGAATLPVEIR